MQQNEQTFTNFVHFVRFNALNLLCVLIFAEFKRPFNWTYSPQLLFNYADYNKLNIPLLPFINIDWVSFNSVPIVVDFFTGFSFLFLFFKPTLRISYIMTFLSILFRDTITISNTGVHTVTAYLIPFLILSILPPKKDNIDKVIVRLLCSISLMYFFSALYKLNSHFTQGHAIEVAGFTRYYMASLLKYFSDYKSFQVVAWGGIILQLMASLILFKNIRKFSILSSSLFHLAVSIWIYLSVNISFFACSLIFLFCPRTDLKKLFYVLLALLPSLPFLQYLTLLMHPEYSDYQGYAFDIASIACALVAHAFALKYVFTDVVTEKNYFSKLGLGLPVVYAGLTYFFNWPIPFGYTQYSTRDIPFYYVYTPLTKAEKIKGLSNIQGRWEIKFQKIPDKDLLQAQFTNQSVAYKFLDYICHQDPELNYKLIVFKRMTKVTPEFISMFQETPYTVCTDAFPKAATSK